MAHSGLSAAFPDGPPLKVTGMTTDGSENCTSCHNANRVANQPPPNSGGGRVSIRAARYTPGVRQTVQVTIQDPAAVRWGFLLTARLASDETKPAGTLASSNADVRVRCDGGAPNAIDNRPYGVAAPCGAGVVNWASQTVAGLRTGQTGGMTFSVDWTPPATDVGAVMFYVAANAANGDGASRPGDNIYTASLKLPGPCDNSLTPQIKQISNAASGGNTVSPVALFSIYGIGLAKTGEQNMANDNDMVAGRVPTSFGCVAVEVNGIRAPIYYTQSDQINAQVPVINTAGAQQVRVIANPGTANEKASAPVNVNLQLYSPAWFQIAPDTIAAVTTDGRVLGDPAKLPGAVAAKPGDVVSLYGTGFGYTNPVWQPGEFADGRSQLRDRYTITAGSTALAASDILFAGLSPQFPGLYQVNIRIPTNAPNGPLPITLSIGGVSTQTGVSIPVQK